MITTKDFLKKIESMHRISTLLVKTEILNASTLGISPDDKEFQYETLAFSYIENFKTKVPNWKYYFGRYPLVANNESLSTPQGPEIVTSETLNYWLKRSQETTNPFLKARYIGLIFDFQKAVTRKDIPQKFVETYIDTLIEIITKNYCAYDFELLLPLNRAFQITLSHNIKPKLDKIKEIVLNIPQYVEAVSSYKLRQWAYYNLLCNKKVTLSECETLTIIKKKKKWQAETLQSNPQNIDGYKNATLNLVEYYYKMKEYEIAKKYIRELKTILLEFDEKPIYQYNTLQELILLYQKYNMREEILPLKNAFVIAGKTVTKSMQKYSTKVNLPAEINKMRDKLLNSIRNWPSEKVCQNFIYLLLPHKKQIIQDINEIKNRDEICFTVSLWKHDHVVAEISSNCNENDKLTQYYVQEIIISDKFVNIEIFKQLVRDNIFSFKVVLDHIRQAQLFEKHNIITIQRGVEHLFNDNYIEAIHLFIPQIEFAVRKIVELNKGDICDVHEGKVLFKPLHKLLDSEQFVSCFSDDIVLYLKAILTSPFGLNIRNELCHGLMEESDFNIHTSIRVFHCLLIVTSVQLTNANISVP